MTITSAGRASGVNHFRISAKARRTAHHLERFVPGDPDEFGVIHRLVRSSLYDSHVTYQRDGECWFAGGVLAEVIVDPRTAPSAQPGGLSSAPLGGHPFALGKGTCR